MPSRIEIFFSYAHEDQTLMNEVRRQLVLFDRQKVIRKWHDRLISAEDGWKGQIDRRLRDARIILLFVSPPRLLRVGLLLRYGDAGGNASAQRRPSPHYPSDPSSLPLADGSLRPVSGGTERWKTTEDLVESGRRLLRCSYPHHGSCQGTPRSGGTRDKLRAAGHIVRRRFTQKRQTVSKKRGK